MALDGPTKARGLAVFADLLSKRVRGQLGELIHHELPSTIAKQNLSFGRRFTSSDLDPAVLDTTHWQTPIDTSRQQEDFRNFAKGHCKRGSRCPFKHVRPSANVTEDAGAAHQYRTPEEPEVALTKGESKGKGKGERTRPLPVRCKSWGGFGLCNRGGTCHFKEGHTTAPKGAAPECRPYNGGKGTCQCADRCAFKHTCDGKILNAFKTAIEGSAANPEGVAAIWEKSVWAIHLGKFHHTTTTELKNTEIQGHSDWLDRFEIEQGGQGNYTSQVAMQQVNKDDPDADEEEDARDSGANIRCMDPGDSGILVHTVAHRFKKHLDVSRTF